MSTNRKGQAPSRFMGWYREVASVALTLALALEFGLNPQWDPLSTTSGLQGATLVCSFLIAALVYLVIQAWPFVLGKVGSAFSYLMDLLASLAPAGPILIFLTLHLASKITQSPINLILMAMWTAVVVFDAVIFGGIGALVNRLTNDLYEMKGRNE